MARSTTSEYQPAPPGLRLRGARRSPARRIRLGAKANCGGAKPCKISYGF